MEPKYLDALAAEVVLAMKTVMAPVVSRIATLERDLKAANERNAELDAIHRESIAGLLAHKEFGNWQQPLSALELRILELETRPAVVGPVGPAGEKGAAGEAGVGLTSLIASADGRLLATFTDGTVMDAGPLPRPEKGEKGDRGEIGPVGPVGPEGKPGPSGRGERGEKGDKGDSGERGERGADGISLQTGIGPPTKMDGRAGDAYLDVETGDIYQCR